MAAAIEVRAVSKRFRLYHERYSSLKERAIHFGRIPHEDPFRGARPADRAAIAAAIEQFLRDTTPPAAPTDGSTPQAPSPSPQRSWPSSTAASAPPTTA